MNDQQPQEPETVAETHDAPAEPDFLTGVQACDLSGEGTCEACQ